MKNKFITLMATVVMVFAMSITAFAATKGWYQDENAKWHYADKNGDDACNEWVGNYFVDEDGVLVTDSVFENDGDYFYVNDKGLKLSNIWAFYQFDEDEDKYWMFFKANGKAVKDGWFNVDGVKFLFDEWKMQTGFIDNNDLVIDMDEDQAWPNAVYFCTINGMYKGWLKVDNGDGTDSWIYFGSNGKKVTGKKTVDGITYEFDAETGAMKDSWFASPSDLKFANADGSVLKNGWIYVEASGSDCGEANWFYFKNGSMLKNTVKKINDKWYAFDYSGKMLTGFVSVDYASKSVCTNIASDDIESIEEFFNTLCRGTHKEYMYFTENDDPMLQGAAVTGKTTLKLALGEKTFNFDKNGVIKFATGSDVIAKVEKNYLYVGGILMCDPDSEYKYMPAEINGVKYVINIKTGKCYKSGTHVDSANEIKFVFTNPEIEIFVKDANGKWVSKGYFSSPV